MKLRKKALHIGAIFVVTTAFAAWSVAQVVVEQSKATSLPNDPLQFLDNSQEAPTGTLLYVAAVRDGNQDRRQSYLVLHRTGTSPQPQQSGIYQVKMPPNVPEVVFDTQFLADGQTILFKAGWPYDSPGYYRFYLWNLATQSLEIGPDAPLHYRRLFPSSDGKFIAYYLGGDAEGDDQGGNRTSPLQLNVYERSTGKSTEIVRNPAAKFAAWTAGDTLLYSAINYSKWLGDIQRPAQPSANPQDTQQQTQLPAATRPDIFEVSALGEKPKLLLEDGYCPVPSPDNQWIAFFTSTDTTKKINPTNAFDLNFPRQSYLCLFNKGTKRRYIIRAVTKSFPQVMWTPDSQRLLVLEQTYQGKQGKARIFSIDVASRIQKEAATLAATDFEPASRDTLEPQFEILEVAKDGSKVFVRTSEFTGQGKFFVDEKKSLKSVDLQSGKVSTLAQILNQQANSLGMDWLWFREKFRNTVRL